MSLETELEVEIKRQLSEGIRLARAGDKVAADEVFDRILSVSSNQEDALVWKAAVTSDRAEAVRCLKQALAVNPDNRRARAGLDWAEQRLQEPPEASAVISPQVAKSIPITPLNNPAPPPRSIFSVVTPVSKPKSETKDQSAPYKKSRFTNQAPALVLPPEALPQHPPFREDKRDKQAKAGKAKSRWRASKTPENGVLSAAAPKIAVTVSESVALGEATDYRKANTVKVVWPLLLFVLALALALVTFLFSSFSPLLGVAALLITLAAIVLFNRAEF